MKDHRIRELEGTLAQHINMHHENRGQTRSRSPRPLQLERMGLQTLRVDRVQYSQRSASRQLGPKGISAAVILGRVRGFFLFFIIMETPGR